PVAQADGASTAAPPSKPAPAAAPAPAPPAPSTQAAGAGPGRREDVIRQRSSPLVRKIAKEHNVDISHLHGTGIAGRVTKDDILGFLGQEGSSSAATGSAAASAGPAFAARESHAASAGQASSPSSGDRVEKMSVM